MKMDESDSEKEVKWLLQILHLNEKDVVRKRPEYGNEQTDRPKLFPIRSAKLLGVKTMKNTWAVCLAAGGANPPKSVGG